jgi:hypothetical protein
MCFWRKTTNWFVYIKLIFLSSLLHRNFPVKLRIFW